MPLGPHQQTIWLTMWARHFSHAAVALMMIGVLALLGARFMEHQIAIGFLVGAGLVYVGDLIIRYIPDPERPVDK